MKVSTNQVTLLDAKELFAPLHKLKLGTGNRATTVCDLFTALGHLVIKTNTGDFKGRADGELWPPVQLTMEQVKQLATMYNKSGAAVHIKRTGDRLKVDTTVFSV